MAVGARREEIKMLKVMWLLKRKTGTTMREFIDYYENRHSVLGAELFAKGDFAPLKYVRKYLQPMTDPIGASEEGAEQEYDVAMELWFHDQAHFDRMIEVMTPAYDIIIEDEAQFLERDKRAVFILEEHETLFDATQP
ncbi:EthD domain-containing protein [Sphingobium sp. AN558]|uniref:EthD domain-containing protein n=1 Tax=Sphingobium sp. AN558 TaxID=3133442 RepID=UPI0030BD44A0